MRQPVGVLGLVFARAVEAKGGVESGKRCRWWLELLPVESAECFRF